MTLYHCMIDLKSDARAMSFALALEAWLTLLAKAGRIGSWRLLRRKLNLAGPGCADFLLEIEVEDLAQLDRAFRFLADGDEDAVRRYEQMHQHIARVEFGLYRPYPDPERAERLAIV